jgi:hypothetical protein
VNCQVSNHVAFAWLPSATVFAHTLDVFSTADDEAFAFLQSRVHELWARLLASSMKDDLRYTPSDCFETFPFPRPASGWRLAAGGGERQGDPLESIGREYYEFRAALMVRNNEGLTKTYNRFQDRDHDGTGVHGRDPADVIRDIAQLRELHDAMDRAVLDAYGWTDIRPTCEFILDYEDEGEDTPGKASKRRKPWRYRWPDDFRDEVLGRLLELNALRARTREEALAGAARSASDAAGPARGGSKEATKGKKGRGGAATPLLD